MKTLTIRFKEEEFEPKNASRHIKLKESINELRRDLTNAEIIMSSN